MCGGGPDGGGAPGAGGGGGVDVASTANNHNGDFGDGCRRSTEKTLDGLSIAWSGAKGTIATLERNAPVSATVEDLRWTGPTAGFAELCDWLDAPRLAERATALAARRIASRP